MFRDAYATASQFIQPVIDLCQTTEQICKAGVASCVVINREGWIVTAAHIVNGANNLARCDAEMRRWEAQRESISKDQSLSAKQKSRNVDALGKPKKGSVRRGMTSWGHHSSRLVDIAIVDEIDLAVGRLEPFKSDWVTTYPVFKDPSKNFMVGTSLCKLGFPFVKITPTFDENTNMFGIPSEMRSIPLFPLDGIFTRTLEVPATAPPFRYAFVETSSPGLRGQSGGPIFDIKGTIWAIQSRTAHQPLDFNPEVEVGGKKHKEHQFLNTGWGVHVETVLGLLNQVGVKHTVSDY